MLPWGRRRLVRVQSQIMGSQSAERLSQAGAYSEDDRRAYASRSATAAPSQLGYDPAMAADGPVMLVNVEVLDDDNRAPQPRYSEPLGVERSERDKMERERFERMERLERMEREEEPRWKRSVERPSMSPPVGAMSPIAAASPPPPQFLRPPFGVSPGGSRARLGGLSPAGSLMRMPMGAVSPAGSRPRLMSPMSPRSPSRQFMYGGGPVVRHLSSGRLTPITPRSGSRSPSWPFMTDRQVMAARQYRRERHNLLEWIMTWVFVVTLAVVLLAILVFYASWQTRLDKKMQEHINLLQRLSQAPHFGSAIFNELYRVDQPTELQLRDLLRTISAKRYIAGTETISTVTNYIDTFMIDNKINHTKIYTYVVSLSHPGSERNTVQLVDSTNNVLMNFELDEPSLGGHPAAHLPAYSAYGRASTVTGQVYYGNRCYPSDLDLLNMKLPLKDAVLLCRYTMTEGPGLAVATAEKKGASAVLLFGHPQDMARGNMTYPHSWWMSGKAIRRANVRRGQDIGDPTTPGYSARYPSTNVHRDTLEETMLPKIPVQPINYDDAGSVLQRLTKLGGEQCPSDWPPVPLGAACKADAGLDSLLLSVGVHNEIQEKNIQNILAFFPGEVEPDRYVVFGVPLDSWGGGAVAPGSALAQALGLCYIINKQYTSKRHPWRPRRTIVFGGWDAHEFGEVGATEFLEGSRHKMSSRTVAYFNSDVCTTGQLFAVTGSPVFSKSFRNATMWVPHITNRSLYNAWYTDLQSITAGGSGLPELPMLRKSGSFLPFVHIAGIPSIDVAFKDKMTRGTYFPAMGTSYDTAALTDNFIDPNYQVHKMCRELLLALVWQWSEAIVLPYDLKELGARLSQEFNELNAEYKTTLDRIGITLDTLSAAVKIFTTNLNHFEGQLSKIDQKNPLEVRRYNDKMMAVERSFVQEVDHKTDPGKLRNVVYGQSDTDHEKMVAYPIIRDKLEEFKAQRQGTDETALGEELRRHISLAVYALLQATHFIEDKGMI